MALLGKVTSIAQRCRARLGGHRPPEQGRTTQEVGPLGSSHPVPYPRREILFFILILSLFYAPYFVNFLFYYFATLKTAPLSVKVSTSVGF